MSTDGYNNSIEDNNISQASSGISISDLNAQIGHSGKFALVFRVGTEKTH